MTTLCDLHFHYGGKWILVPKKDYVGGKVEIEKRIDIDYLSVKDIRDKYKTEFSYKDDHKLLYLERAKSLDDGLIPLEFDKDICMLMSNLIESRGGEVHIYALDEDDLPLYFSPKCAEIVGNEELPEEVVQKTPRSRIRESRVGENLEEAVQTTQPREVGGRVIRLTGVNEETSREQIHEGPCSYAHVVQEEENDNEDDSGEDYEVREEDYESESEEISNLDMEEECSESDELGDEEEMLNSIDENVEEFRKERTNRHKSYVELYVGQSFANSAEFRMAVSHYAVREGVALKLMKSDKKRVRYRCKATCNFMVLASKDGQSDGLRIKTLIPNHTCDRQYINPRATTDFLANYFKETIRGSPECSVSDMIDHAKQYLSLDVKSSMCKRAKRLIIEEISGGYKDEYSCLEAYLNELRISNPGSFFDLQLYPEDLRQEKRIFWRVFVCFHACKTGWLEGCRPIIGLDGSFLKDIAKGQLLVAIGHDAMDHFFPIAWAVVDKETKNSWDWFIGHLKQQLNLGNGSNLTLMSDMQKGLLPAASEQLPMSEHKWCARHVLANWSTKFRGKEIQKHFWSCAWSTFEEEFKDNLKKMGSVNKKVAEHLLKYPPQHWCRAFFSTRCKDHMVDNNMTESFNSWILLQRSRPILRMLEELRVKVMKRLMTYEKMIDSWTTEYSSKSLDAYHANNEISRFCRIEFNGEKGYEVTEGVDRHCVVLDEKRCTCREWQLSGIPCPHAVCALYHAKIDPITVIDKFYHKSMYQSTYKHKLQPVRGRRFWRCDDFEPIEPPKIQRMPGRPKKKRTREPNEGRQSGSRGSSISRKGQMQRCRNCGGCGHKRMKCQGKSISEQSAELFDANSEAITKTSNATQPSVNKGKSVSSGSSNQPDWIKHRQRLREVGYGYLHDDNDCSVIYNPGNVGETVIIEGNVEPFDEAQDVISHNPDPVVTFPIPSEREARQNRLKPLFDSACGTRHIHFSQNEHEVAMPTDLPFEPPKLQWKGKKAMTTRQIEAERDNVIRKRQEKSLSIN